MRKAVFVVLVLVSIFVVGLSACRKHHQLSDGASQPEVSSDQVDRILAKRKAWTDTVGSGKALFATGIGFFQRSSDETANAIAVRQAYIQANMDAKELMIEFLAGINVSESIEETEKDIIIKQTSAMVLRGVVVYGVEVEEQIDDNLGAVSTTLVSSPKTRGELSKPVPDTDEAKEKLQGGLTQVLEEIPKGIVFPMGAKIETIPGTHEIAYIGYGSDIVRNDDPRSASTALKVAEKRARDSLARLMIGEKSNYSAVWLII